jgi:predicted hydrocarbon binding protein
MLFRQEYITQPGFILEKFGSNQLRNHFLSESAVALIETEIAKEPGGKQLLYDSGKEFGYYYAKAVPLPNKSFLFRDRMAGELMKYFQTTYGALGSYIVDWNKSYLEITNSNLAICRKNGLGLWAIGSIAGLWSYICGSKTIEAMHSKCHGRGDEKCITRVGEANDINAAIISPEVKETSQQDKSYFTLNRPIPFNQDYGLDLLRQVGIIKYSASYFDIAGERFFPIEINFLSILEKKLRERGSDERKLIYEPVRTEFEKFGRSNLGKKYSETRDAIDFASKVFSAMGWGLIFYLKGDEKLTVRGYPWTQACDSIKASNYFVGALDGLVQGLTGKKINFMLTSASVSSSSYDLQFGIKKS